MYFTCMSALPADLTVCVPHAYLVLEEAGEGRRSHGIEGLATECWVWNLSLVEEQPVFLTTVPLRPCVRDETQVRSSRSSF